MNKNRFIKIFNRVFVISLPVLAVIFSQVAVNANFKNFCLFRWIFHFECVGCGLTRAFAALCRFEFAKAYEYNHLIVIIVPILFIIWVFLLKYAFKKDNLS